MAELTMFDSLNQSTPLLLRLDFDALADLVVRANYGSIRFLSALVRARRKALGSDDPIADAIEKMVRDLEWPA